MDAGEQIFCWSRDLDAAFTWVGNFLISHHKIVEEKCYTPPRSLDLFPTAVVTGYRKFHGLKQHKHTTLQF